MGQLFYDFIPQLKLALIAVVGLYYAGPRPGLVRCASNSILWWCESRLRMKVFDAYGQIVDERRKSLVLMTLILVAEYWIMNQWLNAMTADAGYTLYLWNWLAVLDILIHMLLLGIVAIKRILPKAM